MEFSETSPPRALDRPRPRVGSVGLDSSGRRRRLYAPELLELARFLWEHGQTLTHATEKDAAAWVRTLRKRAAQGRNPGNSAALQRKIRVARGFFQQLKEMRLPNPFTRSQAALFYRSMRTALTLGRRGVKQLVATMNPKSPWGRRNRAMAFLRFAAHLELAEICGLKRHQLVRGKGGVAIRLPQRGGKSREIPLSREVSAALRKHLVRNSPQGPLVFQAIPGSVSTPPGNPKRPGRPLSQKWVSSMLLGAARAAKLPVARA